MMLRVMVGFMLPSNRMPSRRARTEPPLRITLWVMRVPCPLSSWMPSKPLGKPAVRELPDKSVPIKFRSITVSEAPLITMPENSLPETMLAPSRVPFPICACVDLASREIPVPFGTTAVPATLSPITLLRMCVPCPSSLMPKLWFVMKLRSVGVWPPIRVPRPLPI